jgi:hypothetical protein
MPDCFLYGLLECAIIVQQHNTTYAKFVPWNLCIHYNLYPLF